MTRSERRLARADRRKKIIQKIMELKKKLTHQSKNLILNPLARFFNQIFYPTLSSTAENVDKNKECVVIENGSPLRENEVTTDNPKVTPVRQAKIPEFFQKVESKKNVRPPTPRPSVNLIVQRRAQRKRNITNKSVNVPRKRRRMVAETKKVVRGEKNKKDARGENQSINSDEWEILE